MVTPGTVENVLISEVPSFLGIVYTQLYLAWSLDSVLNTCKVAVHILFQCVHVLVQGVSL